MKKQLVLGMTVALLAVLAVVWASDNQMITLTPTVLGDGASGVAKIEESTSNKGFHPVEIQIKVKDVPSADGTILEGWLIDTDKPYILSLGAFQMNKNGKGQLEFDQHMVNFDLYDSIMVTREPLNDADPTPSTDVLLEGILPLP